MNRSFRIKSYRRLNKFKLLCLTFVCIFLLQYNPVFVQADDHRDNKIRVGFPIQTGFSQVDEEGNLSGYNYDYLQEIAQYTGWEYEFVLLEGDINDVLMKMLDMLKNGELDILGTMSYIESTAETYGFTSYNYGTVYTTLCVLDNNTEITENNYYSKNMRIATVASSIKRTSELDEFIQISNMNVEKVEYKNTTEAMDALMTGEVDAIVNIDNNLVDGIRTIAKFSPRPFYFASTKGNTDIINKINTAILKINDSKPTFSNELFDKYFVEKNKAVIFTQEELDYIKSKQKLRVAIAPDRAPIQYYDEQDDRFKGIGIDVLAYITDVTGLQIEYVRTDSLEELKQLLFSNEVDLVAGIDYNYLVPHEYNIALTTPYLKSQLVIMANRQESAENTEKSTLALGKEMSFIEVTGKDVLWMDTIMDCIDAVNSGKAGYTYSDAVIAQYYATKTNYSNISLVPQVSENHETCIGVAKPADYNLLTIINKVIDHISDSHLQAIVYNNTIQPKEVTLANFINSNPKESFFIVSILAGIIILVLLFYFRLKMKASHKIDLEYERYQQLCEISGEFLFEYDFVKDKLSLSQKNMEAYDEMSTKDNNYLNLVKSLSDSGYGIKSQIEQFKNPIDGSRDIRFLLSDGIARWFRITSKVIRNNEGNPIYSVGKITDIHKEKEEKEILIETAQRDGLTGIYNAAAIRNLISRDISEDKGIMVLMDIDRFKEINDQFGHYVGDEVLKEIAHVLRTVFRKDDIVGRIGGDEFMVFMKHVYDIEKAAEKCKILLNRVRLEIGTSIDFVVTLSIGVAASQKGEEFNELYKRADAAMYIVKNRGRNGFEIAE